MLFYYYFIVLMGISMIIYGLILLIIKVHVIPSYLLIGLNLFIISLGLSSYCIHKAIRFMVLANKILFFCSIVILFYYKVGIIRVINVRLDDFKMYYSNALIKQGIRNYTIDKGIIAQDCDDKVIRIYNNGFNSILCNIRNFRGSDKYKVIENEIKRSRHYLTVKYLSSYTLRIIGIGAVYLYLGMVCIGGLK